MITDKIKLHAHLSQHAPNLIPSCWIITRDSLGGAQLAEGQPHIWRPEFGWKGDGVVVITSQQQLIRAQRQLFPRGTRGRKPTAAVVSTYLDNPLLLDGRKLNVRLYFVVVVEGGRARAAVLRNGMIGVAPSP